MTQKKLVIHLNTNIKMSRGKAAAHAVHAALMAAGVHPDIPVVVLGSKPRDIEKMRTHIHDAGHTELEPGTLTAGTEWNPHERPGCEHDHRTFDDVRRVWTCDFGCGDIFPEFEWDSYVAPAIDIDAAVRAMVAVGREEQHGLSVEEQVDRELADPWGHDRWYALARAALGSM